MVCRELVLAFRSCNAVSGGKGNALEYVARKLKIPFRHIVVCGDSGNDISMFRVEFTKGILVSNSSRELRDFCVDKTQSDVLYRSELSKTRGVIDGLKHFSTELPNFS